MNISTRADLENLFPGGANGQMRRKEPDPPGMYTIDKQQSIFIFQKVNCTGNLTEWIFAAKWYGTKEKFPELQVWRKQSEGYYIKIAYSSPSSILSQSSNNLYTYQPNPPLQVQSGDVLGIHEPDRIKASFTIYLYSLSVPNSYYYRSNVIEPQDTFDVNTMMGVREGQHYPLLSAVIGKTNLYV